MKINRISNTNFKRKLTSTEESEYSNILRQGKEVCGNRGKSVLIVHSACLPQSTKNNTGVGNLNSDDAQRFFEFAKKYWGINEIQLLPTGQFHEYDKEYPIYSGTSMDLGNHMINPKTFNLISEEEYEAIVKSNKVTNRVNYSNVVDIDSAQEKALKKAFENFKKLDTIEKKEINTKFEIFKNVNEDWLKPKSLYRVLRAINSSHDYKTWNEIDSNLFDESKVSLSKRESRISEVTKQYENELEFYKFKQFLANENLKEAKQKLNSKGLKLNGDLICGFSYDEIWANPKAFQKDVTIGWGLPALDFKNPNAEKLLRRKVNLYANRFDGIRIDASWTYAAQHLQNIYTGEITNNYLGDKILNIFDDEMLKVKGQNYNLKNIMHEFAASPECFNIYDGNILKPYVDSRNKIYTSQYINSGWGTNKSYLNRGWNKDSFIIGPTNHDSPNMKVESEQAKELGKILKIPENKLMDLKEFIRAKFAEPMSAFNNMIFYKDALGLEGQFQNNKNADKVFNFAIKIPENYEETYHKALQNKIGFNPMDALEKSFISQGLDKSNETLFKKIVKFRKILESNESSKLLNKPTKTALVIFAVMAVLCSAFVIFKTNKINDKN